jgi:hypothetical protein
MVSRANYRILHPYVIEFKKRPHADGDGNGGNFKVGLKGHDEINGFLV